MLVTEARTPGFCIQLLVEGDGVLEVETLRAAVNRAAEANPGARLVLRGAWAWLRWVDEGPTPPVRVLEAWPGEDPPPELERPLPPREGPTVEVVLAPGPRVVYRCNHAAMDLGGLMHFAEEVSRALRGEAPLGADFTLNDTELVTSMVGPRERAAMKSGFPAVFGGSAPAPSETIWRRARLVGPCPSLVARATTILARVAAEAHGGALRVMIPVDLRNYRKDVRATGNLTSVLYMDIPPDQPWRALQREIIKRLAAKEPLAIYPGERLFPWLPLWLVRWVYGAWLHNNRRAGQFPFSAMVTQLALSGAPLGGAGFNARSVAYLPVRVDLDFLPLVVAAVTSPDAVELVVSGPRGLVSEAQLERLREALVAELQAPA